MNRGIMERSSLMPRKSLDIRFTDQPVLQKRGQCALFLTSGEDRFGQSPIMGQGTSPLQVHRAAPYALGELSNTNICSFQGSFEPIFSTQFFHRLLDTTDFAIETGNAFVHQFFRKCTLCNSILLLKERQMYNRHRLDGITLLIHNRSLLIGWLFEYSSLLFRKNFYNSFFLL